MITVLSRSFSIPVILAKAFAEGLIFLANFAIQRDFIFTNKIGSKLTDWNAYYEKPYKTARVARKITESIIIGIIRKYAHLDMTSRVAELGGAGSCFFGSITRNFKPREYHVYDTNSVGLAKLKAVENHDNLFLHLDDVLSLENHETYDLVFSVGLIEHFSEENTRKAIQSHFRLLRPAGVAIISFPTPTLLYQVARWVAEFSNTWIFHDERPLTRDEVISTTRNYGKILDEKVNWLIVFTQRILVIQKTDNPGISHERSML